MPTNNFYIGEADGWVEVADAPAFVRVSGYPHTHPYYLYSGASAPSLVPTGSTGTVTFAGGVPSADQTVTIGTEVFTFKATRNGPFEVEIGGDNILSGGLFASAVNADSNLVTANANGAGVVTLTSKTTGEISNYTLSETASNVTVSGAAMTGGSDVVQGILMCHHPFKVNVTMTEKLFARIVNPVPNSNRRDGKIRLDVFTI